MAQIIFEDNIYPVREIHHPKYGLVLIGNMTLLDQLMDEKGDWVSYEAEMVDEQIYFYVEDYQMYLNKHELKKLVTKNFVNRGAA